MLCDTDCVKDVTRVPKAKKLGSIDFDQEDTRINVDKDAFQWPNGKGIPLSSPECGFDGLKCGDTTTSTTHAPTNHRSRIGRFFLMVVKTQ